MHAKVKGTKDTVSGLGIVSCNIGTGKQGAAVSSICDNKVKQCSNIPFFFSEWNGVTKRRKWNTAESCVSVNESFQPVEEDGSI